MGIRSATKRKLVDLGVPEEYAKKLALDRTFSEVATMTPAQIRQVTHSSPERAVRVQEQLISWDFNDIIHRVEFRHGMNHLSTSLYSLKEDIESDTAEGALIDVNTLLIDHLSESSLAREDDPRVSAPEDFENEVQRAENDSDEVFMPLQRGIFLELFPDDQSKAIRTVRYLIAEKLGVPMSVMEGFRVEFRSEYQVRLTVSLTEIPEKEVKAVTEGLVDCGRLDAESAQSVLDNSDLAKPHDATPIGPGDTIIEKFPMKMPRVRDPLDKHPDDRRWPSNHAGKAGKVIDRLCFGTLVVEFEEEGRPREFIHECHCKLLPSSMANPNRISPFF